MAIEGFGNDVNLDYWNRKTSVQSLSSAIDKHNSPVLMFCKTYCNYCYNSKSLFNSLGVDIEVVDLDLLSNCVQVQAALAEITGRKAFPQIKILSLDWMGASDLDDFYTSGQLVRLLREQNVDIIT
jgi:glutaredoxin 3